MKEFHIANKTNKFLVYHFFYKGFAKGWTPRSLRWGGVGVAPYLNLDLVWERYEIEGWEFLTGQRPYQRHFLKMFINYREKQLGLDIVAKDLTSTQAYDIENFLRPEGYNCKFDQRIWNSKAGG